MPALSSRKRRLFILISLLAPFLLLAVAELVLRLCGFGGYPPTIARIGPIGGSVLLATDVHGASSYFSRTASRPGSLNEFAFLSPKPPGTVRIFLGGGSAIKGFPQHMAFAPSAFLQELLQQVWPERRVEVINLGTTAVASFPVLEMITEALACEPDLVVIYSGHNEFFGAYGVASVHRAGNSPQALRFQRWFNAAALPQAFERLRPAAALQEEGKTLMEAVVGRANIPPGDLLRTAAACNLEAHLKAMSDRCRARGVPIVLCTLASNERDLAPIGPVDLAAHDPAERTRIERLLAAATTLVANDPAQALPLLEEALKLAPEHAGLHYQFGRALYALGRFEDAARSFEQAVDLDPMPWRAPSTSNAAVRRAAEGGAALCDVQAAFRAASPGGCIGWELMDDHVHPTLEGHYLLARTVLEALHDLPGLPPVSAEARAALPAFAECAARMGDNVYDRYGVAHSMRVIFAVPFMRRSNPGAFDRFNALCAQYEAGMSALVREEALEWQKPQAHTGLPRPITGMVATAMLKDKRFAEAEPLFSVAQRCVPPYSTWDCEYVYRRLACRAVLHDGLDDDDRQEAREAIARGGFLLQRAPEHPGLTHRWLGRLHQLCDEHAEAIPHLRLARQGLRGMELVATDGALIEAYVRTGDVASARQLIADGLATAGEFAEHYRRMQAVLPAQP